jgi:hypothetical protein
VRNVMHDIVWRHRQRLLLDRREQHGYKTHAEYWNDVTAPH